MCLIMDDIISLDTCLRAKEFAVGDVNMFVTN